MLQQIIIISLIITGIYISFHNGYLLAPVRGFLCSVLDRLHLSVLRQPLLECNICMGGVYTLVLYPVLYGLSWEVFPVMLGVIGCNTLVAAVLKYLFWDE